MKTFVTAFGLPISFCLALLTGSSARGRQLKALRFKDSPKTAEQGKKAVTEADLKKVWTELQAAIAAGKLTKEEAAAKINAIKQANLGRK